MNASRVSIAVAVLAAFVAGIALGTFLGGTSGLMQESPRLDPPTVQQSAPPQFRDDSSTVPRPDTAASDLTGRGLVLHLWTTLTLADENARHLEWLRLMPSLSADDAREVREHFRKMKAQGRHFAFEWEVFWPRWGELNGPAAMEQVRVEDAANRPALAEMVLRGWAQANPAEARAWLAANMGADSYAAALGGYVDGLARRDLDRATHDALTLGGQNLDPLVSLLVEQALQQRHANGMLDWWRTLPLDGNGAVARRAAIGPVVSRLEEIDPESAQAWLTELASSPYRDSEQLGSFAERLAATDPARAVSWVLDLPPDEDGHYVGIGRTTRAWAAKDQAGFDRWLASLPSSPVREQVVAAQQSLMVTDSFVITGTSELDQEVYKALRLDASGAIQWKGEMTPGMTFEIIPRRGQ